VDDVGEKDWVAVLVGTGDFKLEFIPAAGADASLSTTGIKMIATVTVVYTGTDAPTYEGVDSEGNTVKVVPLQAKTGGANVITIQGDGVNGTTELTVAQIIGALDFCEGKSVKLPTKADNDKFHEVLKNYTIKIVVSEVVTGN
jgi:hypothetical protein